MRPRVHREAIRTHLATVPARLTAHLTGEQPHVAERGGSAVPAGRRVAGHQRLPGDHRPLDRTLRTTPAPRMAPWRIVYDIEVIVACDHRVHGDAEAASKDRDRVLLAVRECIYSAAGLDRGYRHQPA